MGKRPRYIRDITEFILGVSLQGDSYIKKGIRQIVAQMRVEAVTFSLDFPFELIFIVRVPPIT